MFISWNEIKNKIYNKSDCIWQLKLYRTEWNLRNNQIKGEKQPRMKRKQQTDLKNILAIGLGH